MKIHFYSSTTQTAVETKEVYVSAFGQEPIETADVIVALGGDGTMLDVLQEQLEKNISIPTYGLNYGTYGFLLNENIKGNLIESIQRSHRVKINPLQMVAKTSEGKEIKSYAINDVYINRRSSQSCKLKIYVDNTLRIETFSGDGVIVASSVGSTAYNRSAGGPIIPLNSGLMALTPICGFLPKKWSGAILPENSEVFIEVLDKDKRPIVLVADSNEYIDVVSVKINHKNTPNLHLLFNEECTLNEKLIKEQF